MVGARYERKFAFRIVADLTRCQKIVFLGGSISGYFPYTWSLKVWAIIISPVGALERGTRLYS
jgi:hypothetical protein